MLFDCLHLFLNSIGISSLKIKCHMRFLQSTKHYLCPIISYKVEEVIFHIIDNILVWCVVSVLYTFHQAQCREIIINFVCVYLYYHMYMYNILLWRVKYFMKAFSKSDWSTLGFIYSYPVIKFQFMYAITGKVNSFKERHMHTISVRNHFVFYLPIFRENWLII